jgi:heme A synthase
MSLVIASFANLSPSAIAAMIVGVLAFSAFLAWLAWRAFRVANRAERDPRYLRRWLLFFGAIYVAGAVIGVLEVATGREPIQALIGLPIGVCIAWLYLRTALKIKIPH